MSRQLTHVTADKDLEVVLVISREAAAVVRTELEVVLCSAGPELRRSRINDMIDALTEALDEE